MEVAFCNPSPPFRDCLVIIDVHSGMNQHPSLASCYEPVYIFMNEAIATQMNNNKLYRTRTQFNFLRFYSLFIEIASEDFEILDS